MSKSSVWVIFMSVLAAVDVGLLIAALANVVSIDTHKDEFLESVRVRCLWWIGIGISGTVLTTVYFSCVRGCLNHEMLPGSFIQAVSIFVIHVSYVVPVMAVSDLSTLNHYLGTDSSGSAFGLAVAAVVLKAIQVGYGHLKESDYVTVNGQPVTPAK